MGKEFIIIDDTIKYANGTNPIDERLIYSGDTLWSRKFDLAKKYADINEAVAQALAFDAELPVKLLVIEPVQNGFNVAEVYFRKPLNPAPQPTPEVTGSIATTTPEATSSITTPTL